MHIKKYCKIEAPDDALYQTEDIMPVTRCCWGKLGKLYSLPGDCVNVIKVQAHPIEILADLPRMCFVR